MKYREVLILSPAQAELGQPEDIVRIKEMSRHIGQSAAELDKV
ncbi:MAG: hypothetical protein ACI4JF_04280 [Oscillospiraceae bacterium]